VNTPTRRPKYTRTRRSGGKKSKRKQNNNNNTSSNNNNDLYWDSRDKESGWTGWTKKEIKENATRRREYAARGDTLLGAIGQMGNPIRTVAAAAALGALLTFQGSGGETLVADPAQAVAIRGSTAVAVPVVATSGRALVPFVAPNPMSFPREAPAADDDEDAPAEDAQVQPTSPINGGPAAAGAAAAAAATVVAAAGAGSMWGVGSSIVATVGTIGYGIYSVFKGVTDSVNTFTGTIVVLIVAVLGLCGAAFAANVYAGIAVTSLAVVAGIASGFYVKKKVLGVLGAR